MALIGNAFPEGGEYHPGDYIVSKNGRFVTVLNIDGSVQTWFAPLNGLPAPSAPLNDYGAEPLWQSNPGSEANPAWGSDGNYFLCQQTEGNFCVYRGSSFKERIGLVFESDTKTEGGSFEARLDDNAEFLIKAVGNVKPMRIYGPHVQRNWLGTLISVADGKGNLALSSKKTDQRLPHDQQGCSVQVPDVKAADQQWETWNWDVGIDKPFTKYVFINAATHTALQGVANGAGVVTSPVVSAWSIWKQGAQEVVNDRVCHVYVSLGNQDIGLCVAGDAPYPAGTGVLLWTPRNHPDNVLWDLC